MTCPLCDAIKNEAEEVAISAYEGSMTFQILKTKNSKQHYHRYMIVAEEHVNDLSEFEEYVAKAALFQFMLEKMTHGKNRAGNMYPFTIMEPDHATIKDHWHIVASDYHGEDFNQIEQTTRLVVMKLKPGESWEITEAKNEPIHLQAFQQ